MIFCFKWWLCEIVVTRYSYTLLVALSSRMHFELILYAFWTGILDYLLDYILDIVTLILCIPVIRKTTLHLLSLHHLSSVEILLESLWHLKVQPQLPFKLKVEFKWGFKSLRSVSHKVLSAPSFELGILKHVRNYS